jgi:hypothetical protein
LLRVTLLTIVPFVQYRTVEKFAAADAPSWYVPKLSLQPDGPTAPTTLQSSRTVVAIVTVAD